MPVNSAALCTNYRIFRPMRRTFSPPKMKGKCVCVLWGECRLLGFSDSNAKPPKPALRRLRIASAEARRVCSLRLAVGKAALPPSPAPEDGGQREGVQRLAATLQPGFEAGGGESSASPIASPRGWGAAGRCATPSRYSPTLLWAFAGDGGIPPPPAKAGKSRALFKGRLQRAFLGGGEFPHLLENPQELHTL
ncbi:Hypothetical predicted protein [Podarcis lilfordi]|uniref:Uncharacterized protein n=1 Tax=Podarcis lilfordi TaxID=74358 RepID=A0AA35K2A4_9SAUR|nr:Hypothetical predicted protein [Podarcis lilfordi]